MIDADRMHGRNVKSWAWCGAGLKRDIEGPLDGVSSKFPRSWSSERCLHRDRGENRKLTPPGHAWWSECMGNARFKRRRHAWRLATTTTKTGPDGKDSDR